jgi:hypothetical protein
MADTTTTDTFAAATAASTDPDTTDAATAAATAETAAAARAQAEARRKRILEKSQLRMGVVNGDLIPDSEEEKLVAAKSARIRAARQRRYGKKAEPKASSEEAPPPPPKTKEVDEAVAAAAPKEANAVVEETTTTTTATTESPKENTGEEAPKPKDTETTSTEVPKKSYMGVAKMRRNMLKKKKERAMQEAGSETATHSTVGDGAVAPGTTTKPIMHIPLLAKKKVFVLPIYMHIITVLLLFLAGMDVGLQQHHEEVQIHTQFALVEHGIPLIHRSLWNQRSSDKDTNASKKSSIILGSLLDSTTTNTRTTGDEDEFQDSMEEDMYYEPNIDPLFKVDLDELTKGPGVLYVLARGAIVVHRLFLWAVYYAPKAFFTTVLEIPRALLRTPPMLCLIALVLRQIVATKLLGAGIPIPVGNDKPKDTAIDVLAMAKQYVMNMLSSTFPTAVGLYDTFVHLRSDMYIVICGVFCGLVWAHLAPIGIVVGTTDEL